MNVSNKDFIMHPSLLNLYSIELQLERERKLLNLTPEERLIRKAKLVTFSSGIKLPNINLYKLVREFGKRISQQKMAATVSFHAEPSCCTSCRPLQNQIC
jgi:hypothetical protein